jgi:FAD/FMN-containing dehydrogenase
VDISMLNNILSIDESTKTAVVEPNVHMDKLLRATLARGMVPPVVMEFPGITVGGGFSGSAGESSSFRYGSFDETVKAVEIVLANGDIVKASPTENPDLFRGAAGAAGTLGIVTKLELSLIPAARFVKLTYHRYSTVGDTLLAVRRATEDPENDFVDGIIFSKTLGLVMTGKFTDELPPSTTPQTFSGAWDPWFFIHA